MALAADEFAARVVRHCTAGAGFRGNTSTNAANFTPRGGSVAVEVMLPAA